MEFRDLLARRRQYYGFLRDPVSPDVVDRIARVIRRAPSGGFSQGQSLVVVTDPVTRARLAQAFEEERYVEQGFPPFISRAPVHVVVSANERLYHERYNEPDKLEQTGGVEITWPVPYWFVDAGALMMLVHLAALDEGLGATIIGHPDQKRIFDDILGLPKDVVPIGLILLGYPSSEDVAPRRSTRLRERRRPFDAVVHRERWRGDL